MGAIGMQGFQQSLRCLVVRKGFVRLTLWWTKFSTSGKPKQSELSRKTLCADHGLQHRTILVFLSSILATGCHQSTLIGTTMWCHVLSSCSNWLRTKPYTRKGYRSRKEIKILWLQMGVKIGWSPKTARHLTSSRMHKGVNWNPTPNRIS